MFDLLTQDELDELTDMFCNALDHMRWLGWRDSQLACEIRTLEHDAWHTRCSKAGVRCLHRHEGVAA